MSKVDSQVPASKPLSPSECAAVAEFLQGFSNPVRVRILCCLEEGPKSVGEVGAILGEKTSNVSQQLKILLQKGFVTRRREERLIFYELRDRTVCELMRKVLEVIGGEEKWRG